MVAKETKYDQHFIAVLLKRKMFKFNKCLCGILCYSPTSTHWLCFLSCSVLLLEDPSWHIDGLRGMLVEKMLDTDCFHWMKWNDNNGSVQGQKCSHNPIDVDFELKELQREGKHTLGTKTEDEENSDDDDSVSDVELERCCQAGGVQPL